MKLKLIGLAVACLMLAACGRESPNSDGNGPGGADGVGGREDPPAAAAAQDGDAAKTTEPPAADAPAR